MNDYTIKVLKENGTVVLNPQWDKKLQKFEHQIY